MSTVKFQLILEVRDSATAGEVRAAMNDLTEFAYLILDRDPSYEGMKFYVAGTVE